MTFRTALVLAPLVLAGCGGSHAGSATSTTSAATTTATAAPAATTTTAPAPPNALQGEANSAAAGDIPDNQVFLTFRNRAEGYAMKYPEGWAQSGNGPTVTFRDKNNIARVVVAHAPAPSPSSIRAQLRTLTGARVRGSAQPFSITGSRAFKIAYSTVSAPNGVTGKRVTLTVDRYYVWHTGRLAIVDLGTPVGVDNVDAYRLMIESFRWR